MKRSLVTWALALGVSAAWAQASPVGVWKTIDDDGKTEKSLVRISDSGGRYQCDDCGLHSVGWYWRCPKCRSWDTLRPAVFKWAERSN